MLRYMIYAHNMMCMCRQFYQVHTRNGIVLYSKKLSERSAGMIGAALEHNRCNNWELLKSTILKKGSIIGTCLAVNHDIREQ